MDETQKLSQELSRRIVNAGNAALFFGFLFTIGSLISYLLLPDIFFAFVTIFGLQILVGLSLIFLGFIVRSNPTFSSQKYLKIVLVLGVITFFLDFFLASAVSFASLYLIVSSLSAINSARKLESQESLANELQKRTQIKNWSARQKVLDFLKVVLIAICVLGAFVLTDYAHYVYTSKPALSSDQSVNAVVVKMPEDDKTKSDYVISHDVLSLIVKGGSYETGNHMNYSDFCSTADATSLLAEIAKLNVGGTSGVRCSDSDYGLAISSSLNNGGYMCMDSTGYHSSTESALHSDQLCAPLASTTKPTWYVIIPKGNPLTKAKVNAEYDSFLPIDNVGPVQVVAGQLPSGLRIACATGTSCDGKEFLMGAPAKEGTYTFTVAYFNGSYKLTTTFTLVVAL